MNRQNKWETKPHETWTLSTESSSLIEYHGIVAMLHNSCLQSEC